MSSIQNLQSLAATSGTATKGLLLDSKVPSPHRKFQVRASLEKYKHSKSQGKITFQIAYHAYSQGLGDPIFWDDSNATNSVKTKIINFKNLNVLLKSVE